MAGLGKMLKQMQKMQKQMTEMQDKLAEEEIVVSKGGGAVKIIISGQGEFKNLQIDPEFLKEDAETVQSTILEAIQDAARQSKSRNESEMSHLTSGLSIPGLM